MALHVAGRQPAQVKVTGDFSASWVGHVVLTVQRNVLACMQLRHARYYSWQSGPQRDRLATPSYSALLVRIASRWGRSRPASCFLAAPALQLVWHPSEEIGGRPCQYVLQVSVMPAGLRLEGNVVSWDPRSKCTQLAGPPHTTSHTHIS